MSRGGEAQAGDGAVLHGQDLQLPAVDPDGVAGFGEVAQAVHDGQEPAGQAARVLPGPGVAVVPIMAIHGVPVPWGKVVTDGVRVVSARRLPSMLRALPVVMGSERVAGLTDQARFPFHPAA